MSSKNSTITSTLACFSLPPDSCILSTNPTKNFTLSTISKKKFLAMANPSMNSKHPHLPLKLGSIKLPSKSLCQPNLPNIKYISSRTITNIMLTIQIKSKDFKISSKLFRTLMLGSTTNIRNLHNYFLPTLL